MHADRLGATPPISASIPSDFDSIRLACDHDAKTSAPETQETNLPPPDNPAAEDATEATLNQAADPQYFNALVSSAVSGEPDAINKLLTEIHPSVLRYCRSRLGGREVPMGSADDVAQDVCLAVVSSLPGYVFTGPSFRAYVYGIAAHKIADAYRASGRNRTEPVPDVPDTLRHDEGPEGHFLKLELGQELGKLLLELTTRQREVLFLRIAVGLSAEETVAAIGGTATAVRVMQHRALGKLRGILDSKPDSETADGLTA